MPDLSDEAVDQASDALGGLADLLCSIERGNLHLVRPDNLCALVELIRKRLDGGKPSCRPGE